jgi:hypothetical protein
MAFLISKILSASSERARRLDNFNKTFSKDLDYMIARQKNEIRQNYSQEFNHELNQAEICANNGAVCNTNINSSFVDIMIRASESNYYRIERM